MAEPLTLENYKAQFDEEDPFDAEDMEELSDSENIGFESMSLPWVVGQVSDEGEGAPRRYSTSPAGLKRVFERETVGDQLSDDGEEERDYDYELCGNLPRDHDTWENDRLFFFGKHHWFTSEDVWGHNVVWHPRIFQSAVKTGKWVMAMKEAGGKWSGMNRLAAGSFKKKARDVVVEHSSVMNPERSFSDVTAYASQKLHELYIDKCWSFECLSTHSKRHRLVALTGACRNLRRTVSIREAVQEETKETMEVTEETAHDLPERGRAKYRQEKRRPAERGHAGRGRAERGRLERIGREGVERKGSRVVLEGHDAGVLETGGGEYERRASEGVSVDVDSKSTTAPGEEELYPGAHAVQREEETQHWQSHKREEETQHWSAHEVLKGLDAGVLVTGTSEEVLHSRSAVATTREGFVKGGQWTLMEARLLGDEEGKEEPVGEARVHGDEKGGEPLVEGGVVAVGILMDPERKDDDSLPTRCGEEQGDRASVLSTGRKMILHEAIELGDDSAATELVSDSGVVEVQNVESSVEGGEVSVSIQMDPERKDHNSPSTYCGKEQGDRASVLSTVREMVLHEAIELRNDSAATELVSDTAVAEVQNVKSSVDVGTMARQEGDFPQRAPEHDKICE
ncbi:hypothetical protein CBR_g31030 [Chara braunii]|uniref:Uncharacterized protein n=1 Tax=Chara braunii TaxID=69332 RepID=A0A388LE37_CHABU|nr:hypothetical protein CBR_g31030 [Chara braunii]|eukprot:GBG80570.1 hypothetical protein CBR_g31030 [Chara braunii]